MLSLSANGLNGDYRRVSDDDTEFISIIEDDYLSMQCIPNTVSSKGGTEVMLTSPSFTDMTVEQIADEIGKTVRGVKTMLTRRGLQCANYNGAAKKEIG